MSAKQKVTVEEAVEAYVNSAFDCIGEEWRNFFEIIDENYRTQFASDDESQGLFALFIIARELRELKGLVNAEIIARIKNYIGETFTKVGLFAGHELGETFKKIDEDIDEAVKEAASKGIGVVGACGAVLFKLFRPKFYFKYGETWVGDPHYLELLGTRALMAGGFWKNFLKDYVITG